MKRISCWLTIAGAVMILPDPAAAQSASEKKYQMALYLQAAGMDGTVGAGPVTADVNLSFSDVLENLQFGAMGAFRADLGRRAFMSDVMFLALGASKNNAVADVDEWVVEVDGAYSVNDRLEILAGARIVSLDAGVVVTRPAGTLSAGPSETWVDPLVGARVTVPFAKRWQFIGRGDIGGFGVGSDLAWNAVASVDVQLKEKLSLRFGYRWLDWNYDKGTGADRFVYDVLVSGPAFALVLHF